MWEFYRQSDQVARKNHKCYECNHSIKKDEKYHKSVGKFDGDFFVRKSHLDCNSLCDQLHSDADLCDDEGIDLQEEMYHIDRPWLIENYPKVAERFGIK